MYFRNASTVVMFRSSPSQIDVQKAQYWLNFERWAFKFGTGRERGIKNKKNKKNLGRRDFLFSRALKADFHGRGFGFTQI